MYDSFSVSNIPKLFRYSKMYVVNLVNYKFV